MKICIRIAVIIMVLAATAQANRITNPGFEVPGQSEETASSWSDTTAGGMWGSAVRTDWQSHRGNFSAAIRAAWSGQDNGGLWQACSVSPNLSYVLTAYFYWDNDWHADKTEWRIEWYRGDELLAVDRQQIQDIPEASWTLRSFPVKAPDDAEKAHFVLDVSGTSTEGVLYVDEIDFEHH